MRRSNHILSRHESRNVVISAQQLMNNGSQTKEQGFLDIIEHLGYVQIDTLAVVSRAHHHVLWSRNNVYNESILNKLMSEDKSIFEYWSHAASYLPMKDYRFSLFKKKEYASGKSHWFEQDKKIKKYVLDKIKAEGSLQSKDFEHTRNVSAGWYDWKPAKKALEQLFMEGKLMVAKRQGFQKVYDLTERVLPSHVNTKMPSKKEYIHYLIDNMLRSHGIIEISEIGYLQKIVKSEISKIVHEMIKTGELEEVEVEGVYGKKYLSSKVMLEKYSNIKKINQVHLLSPFDNLIIQRKRIKQLFKFDYAIECYLPEHKRQYGYFCLPVLFGNEFVARLDPKADKANRIFYIKQMHFEHNFKPTNDFNKLFAEKLKAFVIFNSCDQIIIEKANSKWKKEMQKHF